LGIGFDEKGFIMQKLPIGIQTFRDIREESYIYIDKTDIAYDLITSERYFFLSRPRRFGKSLFLDTLKNIFEGKKELFEGLAIYDKWDWSETYPVIKISYEKYQLFTSLVSSLMQRREMSVVLSGRSFEDREAA